MAYGKSKLTNPQIVRLELLPPDTETADLLRRTMERLRVVANRCVRTWLRWHEDAGTAAKIEAREAVHPCPPELTRLLYRQTQDACPDVNGATVLAAQNWFVQTITRQKSPRVNEKRWRRVLRMDESHWSFNDPLPIRLWNANAKFVRSGGDVQVVVRLDRVRVEGRKTCSSTPIALTLLRPSHGKRSDDFRADYEAACEVADGVRDLSQSQLFFERGKWFVCLTVDGPKPAETAIRDKTQVMVIRPGRHNALRFRFGATRGGFGDVLDRLSRVRSSVDEGWRRWKTNHPGVPIPQGVGMHLSSRWRNQCSAICDVLVAEVVGALRKRAIGRVVWLDGHAETAALAVAGKSSERDVRNLFPFELLRRKAEKRLTEIGVEFVGRANERSVKQRSQRFTRRKSAASGGVELKSAVVARKSGGATVCAKKTAKARR